MKILMTTERVAVMSVITFDITLSVIFIVSHNESFLCKLRYDKLLLTFSMLYTSSKNYILILKKKRWNDFLILLIK